MSDVPEDIDDIDLRGRHTHLCPRCFDHVLCHDDCSFVTDDLVDFPNKLPGLHPVLCEDCLAFIEQHQFMGSGI